MRLSLFLTLLALPGIKSSDNSDYRRRYEENERKMQEYDLEAGRREIERRAQEAKIEHERKQDLDEYTKRYNEYQREKEALERERNNW